MYLAFHASFAFATTSSTFLCTAVLAPVEFQFLLPPIVTVLFCRTKIILLDATESLVCRRPYSNRVYTCLIELCLRIELKTKFGESLFHVFHLEKGIFEVNDIMGLSNEKTAMPNKTGRG